MTAPIVFVHGRGPNPDPAGWIDPLREAIRVAGHTPPGADEPAFVAVDYRELLTAIDELPPRPLPRVTLDALDPDARESYLHERILLAGRFPVPRTLIEGQQLADLLSAATVRAVPLAHLPLQDRGLVEVLVQSMDDVEHYRRRTELRAAVLHRVLEALPENGEAILIGHSLGSVVALDAVSYLPPGLRLALLLTTGSPLAYRTIRGIGLPGIVPNLPFPHQRVGRWVNLVDTRDAVTGFTGLHDWWPEVVDVDVDNPPGQRHAARSYLGHRAVGELVGEARGVSRVPDLPRFDLAQRLDGGADQAQILAEISLHYARILLESEDSSPTRERARHARDQLLVMLGEIVGRQLTPDACEAATHAWRERSDQLERRVLLARLALANPFEPFDPGISEPARRRALARLAGELGIPDAEVAVDDLLELFDKARRAVAPRSRARVLRPLLVGAGAIGLLAVAAPAAVALFGAAGVGGAAALTSGLAAMGGGGMAGGLSLLGGAGAGGGLLAAQLARSGADAPTVAAHLVAVGGIVRWLRRWGDEAIAARVDDAADALDGLREGYAEQLAFHAGRSDPDAEVVTNLTLSIGQTGRLITWLADREPADREHRTPAGVEAPGAAASSPSSAPGQPSEPSPSAAALEVGEPDLSLQDPPADELDPGSDELDPGSDEPDPGSDELDPRSGGGGWLGGRRRSR